MNTEMKNCSCTHCVGASCTCGCQTPAAPASACQCGCQQGAPCQCGPRDLAARAQRVPANS